MLKSILVWNAERDPSNFPITEKLLNQIIRSVKPLNIRHPPTSRLPNCFPSGNIILETATQKGDLVIILTTRHYTRAGRIQVFLYSYPFGNQFI